MKILSTLILLFFAFFNATSQDTPVLQRVISISVTNESLPVVLNKISEAARFSFSYNPANINEDQIISINAKSKSVKEILDGIFKETVSYKERSNYLILTKTKPKVIQSTTVLVSGYVQDAKTGKRLADTHVYDKNSITSMLTNEYGFFQLTLDKKQKTAALSARKKNYKDTLVGIALDKDQFITIAIQSIQKDSVIVPLAKLDSSNLNSPNPFKEDENLQLYSDTLYKDVQVSILPYLGTNGWNSGRTINDYSINFFGGYARGTRQIELGFFINADRDDVSWLQIAGIGNLVGRNVYGIQAAGIFNLTGGEVKAAQLSGATTINLGEVRGFQVTGLANINLKSGDGVLAAGLANIVLKSSKGVQVAGLTNLQLDGYHGTQVAGLLNLNKVYINGSQVSGLANIATDYVGGSQISGLFNYAKNVKGFQFGLVNVADSLSGIPIGLLSIVKKGYHKLEISADEVFYANLSFRTGVRKFYNILHIGFKPSSLLLSETVWSFGYGIGAARKIARWLDLNLDLSTDQVNKDGFTNSLSLLNKAYLGFDARLAPKFAITFGITLNGYLTDKSHNNYPNLFTDFHPSIISNRNLGKTDNLIIWWGARVGLRFF
jgi:hypothetical protein